MKYCIIPGYRQTFTPEKMGVDKRIFTCQATIDQAIEKDLPGQGQGRRHLIVSVVYDEQKLRHELLTSCPDSEKSYAEIQAQKMVRAELDFSWQPDIEGILSHFNVSGVKYLEKNQILGVVWYYASIGMALPDA